MTARQLQNYKKQLAEYDAWLMAINDDERSAASEIANQAKLVGTSLGPFAAGHVGGKTDLSTCRGAVSRFHRGRPVVSYANAGS